MKAGLNQSMKAGITIIAQSRHEPMESNTRYPKYLIERNPEINVAEKPAMTLRPLITMLLPVVRYVMTIAAAWLSPLRSSLLYLHRNWMVKSTPTPIIIEESNAVAASMAILVSPITPNCIMMDTASGIDPIKPPRAERKITDSSINTASSANSSDVTCPCIIFCAKSAIMMAYPPRVISARKPAV